MKARRFGVLLAGVAAVAVGASPWLPWVQFTPQLAEAVGFEDPSLTATEMAHFLSAKGATTFGLSFAWTIVAFAVVALAFVLLTLRSSVIAPAVIIGLAFMLLVVISTARGGALGVFALGFAEAGAVTTILAPGVWLASLGSAAMLVGAILVLVSPRSSPQPAVN